MDTTVFQINIPIYTKRGLIAGRIMDKHVQITNNTNLNAEFKIITSVNAALLIQVIANMPPCKI
jgi:hypothetical protein